MLNAELEQGYPGRSAGRSADLWSELVGTVGADLQAEGARVAAGMEPAHAALLARVLPGILDLVGVEPAAKPLATRVDEVVRALRPELLTLALRELDVAARRRFAEDLCEHATPGALVPLVLAAAPTYGHPLSQPFRDLVEKLAAGAAAGAQPLSERADADFRSLVRQVFERWTGSQVDAGSTSFDALFQRRRQDPRASRRVLPESVRVLQLALETGALGPMVWSALSEHIETDTGMRAVMELLKRAPQGRARDAIAEQIATPARLTALLVEEPVDWAAIDALLPQLGALAIPPLLTQLAESGQRATRRALMDRLVRLGPEIKPAVLERLNDRRWYVVRNMVSLLREAGCSLGKVPIEHFAQHPDARVRREVLQLRMEFPEHRDTAVAEALLDPDRQVLRTALQAARTRLAPTAAAMLAQRVSDPAFPPEFRVLSLHLLGRSGEPAALEALLQFVNGGRTLFGKPKLAPASPEMLAALSGLARSWPEEKRVRELLVLAARSHDTRVHGALQMLGAGEEAR